jgi:hypothetical protein
MTAKWYDLLVSSPSTASIVSWLLEMLLHRDNIIGTPFLQRVRRSRIAMWLV